MAKRALPPQHDDHINVTPLIDIVMCLIIFFMVCGKMAQDESSGQLIVPKANKARELEDKRHRLIVNVEAVSADNDEVVLVDSAEKRKAGRARFLVRGKKVSEDEIIKKLREEKAADPDMRLLIRADRDLPYPLISPLIVACARADIGSMHFATEYESQE